MELLETRTMLSITVTVPGTANPYLADPSNMSGSDPFDGTRPPSIAVAAGETLRIVATGQTRRAPDYPFSPTPDGAEITNAHYGAIRGISSWTLPLDSLVGVFLGSTIQSAPAPSPDGIAFQTTSPLLGQVFFIGDGLTGTGAGPQQQFHVPPGATQLFLANLDGYEWANNGGSFTATVGLEAAPAVPTGLVATANGPQSIQLRWNATLSAGNYFLERAPQSTGQFQQIAILASANPKYLDQGSHLAAGATYVYRVRAVSNGVSSAYSSTAAASTPAVLFDPGPRVTSPMLGDFGNFTSAVSSVLVTFSEPIVAASFTPSDVQILLPRPIPTSNVTAPPSGIRSRPPTGDIWVTPSVIERLTDTVFKIRFNALSLPGQYLIRIGPNVLDIAQNPMNQTFVGKWNVLAPLLQGTAVRHDGGESFGVSIRHWEHPSDNPTIPIRLDAVTWIVIHGRESRPAADNIHAIATALDKVSDSDQVLVVDWSAAAESGLFGGESYIVPVATWVAKALAAYGLRGSQLNLVGHSWGSYVAEELAERTNGGVNSIVALDPAENYQVGPFGNDYNPDADGEVNFAYYSGYSWAFKDVSGSGALPVLGSNVTPQTADEAYLIEGSNHGGVVYVFESILLDIGPLGAFFATNRLLNQLPGPMRLDAYSVFFPPPEYEGAIASDDTGTRAIALRYIDRQLGVEVQLSSTSSPVEPGLSALARASPESTVAQRGAELAQGIAIQRQPGGLIEGRTNRYDHEAARDNLYSALGQRRPSTLRASPRMMIDELVSEIGDEIFASYGSLATDNLEVLEGA